MSLRPFDLTNESSEVEIPDEITDILVNSGVVTKKNKTTEAREIFDEAGAGIEDVARHVANIMKNGDSENARLKACEIAMEVQGVLKALDEKQIPEININIIGDNSKSIINLVLP